jgi:epoxyqueuosine reductase QueG
MKAKTIDQILKERGFDTVGQYKFNLIPEVKQVVAEWLTLNIKEYMGFNGITSGMELLLEEIIQTNANQEKSIH